MLRVSIIGCGKVADAHVDAIKRIGGCDLVGVCDKEVLMAEQLRERYGLDAAYGDVGVLLDKARPDVIHVTSPPQSHFPIAKQCLEYGCHVYVEKPFTVNAKEAHDLIALAESRKLKLTVGHDDQFSHVARRLRASVLKGYLGGRPVHMESYYGYEMSGEYAKAFLGDADHWVRRLPGQLLQNIISHGIARVAEYIQSDAPLVAAYGFSSQFLRKLGETRVIDELRVMIAEDECTTAYFTFSSQMRPSLHQFRIYGPTNGLVLDEDDQTLIHLAGKRLPSYAAKFLPPAVLGKQYLGNLAHNTKLFLKADFHMKSGLRHLIELFYRAVSDDAPLPIPYREIVLTAKIMDSIFQQLAPVTDANKRMPAADPAHCRDSTFSGLAK